MFRIHPVTPVYNGVEENILRHMSMSLYLTSSQALGSAAGSFAEVPVTKSQADAGIGKQSCEQW